MGKDRASEYEQVSFIRLKGADVIEGLDEMALYAVPVQMENPDAGEITVEAIAAGLVKVLSQDESYLKNVDDFADADAKTLGKIYNFYRKFLLKIHPACDDELLMQGLKSAGENDWENAELLMLAAKNISRKSAAYVQLAVLYANLCARATKKKDERKAEMLDDCIFQILNEGLKYNPGDADILIELGGYHLRHRELDLAVGFFEDGVAKVTDKDRKKELEGLIADLKTQRDHENSILAAYDQLMMGNQAKALEIMEGYLAIEKGSWEGWYVKGWALRCLERYEEANEALVKCISLNGEFPSAYNEMAICAKEAGNAELAKEYLKIAADLDGENVIYEANLAYLYLAENDFNHARFHLDRARALDPEDGQVIDLIEEYETLSGEKLGDVIVEEIHTADEVEEIEKAEHEKGHHAEHV